MSYLLRTSFCVRTLKTTPLSRALTGHCPEAAWGNWKHSRGLASAMDSEGGPTDKTTTHIPGTALGTPAWRRHRGPLPRETQRGVWKHMCTQESVDAVGEVCRTATGVNVREFERTQQTAGQF